jgi:hypothetical protein
MAYRYWTEEEIDYLRQHYGKVRIEAMPLNRSRKSVEKKAAKLGLRSKYPGSPLWADSAERLPDQHGRNHWAWRKPGEVWATGGQMYIKPAADCPPRLYARYLMEQAGHDLRGKVVRHKDGNALNCKLDNLQVISRSTHAAMNSRNCHDPDLRRIRHRISRGKTTFLDEVLQGAFI